MWFLYRMDQYDLNRMNNKKKELQRLLWMANVQGFYPDKPAVELEAGYQQWMINRQHFAQLYQEFRIEEVASAPVHEALKSLTKGILFTFHFGPYRLLPRYLVAAGYRLTLLVSTAVLEKERARYAQDLSAMGLPKDSLECLDASDTLVLRKMLYAIASDRIILVFLDANEYMAKDEEKEQEARLRVSFGNSYFYWRSNLLKLAHRFGLSVHAIHLMPQLQNGRQTWQLSDPVTVLTPKEKDNPMALLTAFAKLQHVFQAMMGQNWSAWENWGLMHFYRGFDERAGSKDARQGSYMVPFSFADKGYLFDLSRKLFYEIIAKKENII